MERKTSRINEKMKNKEGRGEDGDNGGREGDAEEEKGGNEEGNGAKEKTDQPKYIAHAFLYT
jgi:hypothetical protein